MIVIVVLLILAGAGVLAGLKIGHDRRAAIEEDLRDQIEQQAADEAALEKEKEEALKAEAARKEEERRAALEEEERLKTQQLLEDQVRETNRENASVISRIAAFGVFDVSSYAEASALTPEEITIHRICLDAGEEGDSVYNLAVTLKLKAVLEGRGYQVVMTKTSPEEHPDEMTRAAMPFAAGAEVMVTIRSARSANPEDRGVYGEQPAEGTPGLSPDVVARSSSLTASLLNGMCAASGAQSRGVASTQSRTADNWTTVPWTFISTGFLTNEEENALMATDDYQLRLAEGLADGLDAWLGL